MGLFQGYNDYELLYLIKENNEIALNIMFEKYCRFIKMKLRECNVSERYFDDFYQEGIILLMKIIYSFDDSFNKTFTKYFEFVLERRIYRLLKEEKNNYYCNDYIYDLKEEAPSVLEEMIVEYNQKKYEDILSSSLELDVLKYYIIEGLSITTISSRMGISKKQVYNAIARIKKKIKELS